MIFACTRVGRALGLETEAMFVAVGVAIASTMLVVEGLEDPATVPPSS